MKQPLPIATTRYYNHFEILEVRDKIPLCEDLHFHTLELSKFLAPAEEVHKPVDVWSYFLKHGKNLDGANLPEHLALPAIEYAVKELTMFTQDEIARELYESRRMAMMDYNSMIAAKEKAGFQDGYKDGVKDGAKKGKEEAVMNALKLGLDTETIHKITGVATDDIEKMRKELGMV